MKIHQPLTTRPQLPVSTPRFGFGAAPSILRAMDYSQLGTSTVFQNKINYATCIGSRIYNSRSPRERWENIRRDCAGWYFWFMGSPLMQTALALTLIPLFFKDSEKLLISRNAANHKANPLQKAFWTFFNPSKLWRLASDAQLHQRKEQIVEAIQAQALNSTEKQKLLKETITLFEKTRILRALVSFLGMAFTFFALGVGIIKLNIWLTKRSVNQDMGNNPKTTWQQPVNLGNRMKLH